VLCLEGFCVVCRYGCDVKKCNTCECGIRFLMRVYLRNSLICIACNNF